MIKAFNGIGFSIIVCNDYIQLIDFDTRVYKNQKTILDWYDRFRRVDSFKERYPIASTSNHTLVQAIEYKTWLEKQDKRIKIIDEILDAKNI